MKSALKEILTIADVHGVLFFSLKGKLLFHEFDDTAPKGLQSFDWKSLLSHFNDVSEGELAFENYRVFLKQSELGIAMVLMGWDATIAMVRLKTGEALALA